MLRALTVALLAGVLTAACGDDDTSTSATTAVAGASLRVEAHDIKFDADTYTAPAGTIAIAYVEKGKLVHDLVVEGADGDRIPIDGGDDEGKLIVSTAFDASGTVTLDPGSYRLVCTVPGHEQAGMKAMLTVT